MRTALVWMALGALGLAACRSDRPSSPVIAPGSGGAAAGVGGSPTAGGAGGNSVAGTADADPVDSTGASDSGEAADGSDAGTGDGSGGGDVVTSDRPAVPPGPRPVKRSPGCGKGNRAEGYRTIESGGRQMPFTVRLPVGYDPDRPSPLGLAFPDYTYPQCTVQCTGFTGLDAITLFPRSWSRYWDETEEARQSNTLFFEDMIAVVKNEYCVDENRIFVAGAGSGAAFAQQLACKHGDWLWQVAAISAPGPHLDQACRGTPAALVIHSVEGNGADVGQAVAANLAARNGCSATPPPGLAAARNAMLAAYRANRPDQRCVDWAGCTSPVRLCLLSNRVYTPGDQTQGYRGWPTSGGSLIAEFLEQLE